MWSLESTTLTSPATRTKSFCSISAQTASNTSSVAVQHQIAKLDLPFLGMRSNLFFDTTASKGPPLQGALSTRTNFGFVVEDQAKCVSVEESGAPTGESHVRAMSETPQILAEHRCAMAQQCVFRGSLGPRFGTRIHEVVTLFVLDGTSSGVPSRSLGVCSAMTRPDHCGGNATGASYVSTPQRRFLIGHSGTVT